MLVAVPGPGVAGAPASNDPLLASQWGLEQVHAPEAWATAKGDGAAIAGAAGNEAVPVCDNPASDPAVLCVSGTDKHEALSPFSNFAKKADMLGLAAPGGSAKPSCGENVLSTVPRGRSFNGALCGYGTDY